MYYEERILEFYDWLHWLIERGCLAHADFDMFYCKKLVVESSRRLYSLREW